MKGKKNTKVNMSNYLSVLISLYMANLIVNPQIQIIPAAQRV